MFNSIRKDDSCRKLVKSFEILRLQNKIIVQAMSISDIFSMQVDKKVSDVTFFGNPADIVSNARREAKPSPLGEEQTTVEENKPLLLSSKPLILTSQNEKHSTIDTDLPFCKAFYNYNCFTDLELCKSSLYLFAKKRAKAENESKKTAFSIFPKIKDNNKSSSPKMNASYKAFSSSLLSLAKGRINSLPRNSSKGRIKNRCIETGRSHSVLRFCKLSRICLRDNASKALISGISKASW